MLIFNEETACATYPFQNDETIVWFPNNFLRNVARLPQKQTEGLNLPDFFIGIDVDLIPSPQFVALLSNFVATKPQKEMNLYLVVVFEAKNQKIISDIKNKQDLMKNYPDSVNIFHSWCDVCYNYYDYDRWLNLKYSEETPEVGYEVQYKLSFEPYFLAEVSNCYWFTGHCPISGKLIHEELMSSYSLLYKIGSGPDRDPVADFFNFSELQRPISGKLIQKVLKTYWSF